MGVVCQSWKSLTLLAKQRRTVNFLPLLVKKSKKIEEISEQQKLKLKKCDKKSLFLWLRGNTSQQWCLTKDFIHVQITICTKYKPDYKINKQISKSNQLTKKTTTNTSNF